MSMGNLFQSIPKSIPEEIFEEVLQSSRVRVERILSQGQSSPRQGWYDQQEHEWVLVLRGHARLGFECAQDVELKAGDHVTIPAHCRHRVAWTDPDQVTIWLAVFYRPEATPGTHENG